MARQVHVRFTNNDDEHFDADGWSVNPADGAPKGGALITKGDQLVAAVFDIALIEFED